MKQLVREIWAALHTRDMWLMIVIVIAVALILGILTGHWIRGS